MGIQHTNKESTRDASSNMPATVTSISLCTSPTNSSAGMTTAASTWGSFSSGLFTTPSFNSAVASTTFSTAHTVASGTSGCVGGLISGSNGNTINVIAGVGKASSGTGISTSMASSGAIGSGGGLGSSNTSTMRSKYYPEFMTF
ncbi:unnamed protein product [Protopolystoma xenopodis]|uniref:Uncharacterized protein n=1 Tax=Protopolystoma xenopodis TaxID=117903 RepID=A0A3S5AM03_9PLAT|nr:unnamed protein product [Protopolystoma xenopodis]